MFGELANNSIFLCKRKLKVNQSVFCSPTRGHVVQLGNVCCRTVVRPFIMLQCQYYLFKHLRFSKKQIHKKKVSLREFKIAKDLTCVLSLWVTFIEDQ